MNEEIKETLKKRTYFTVTKLQSPFHMTAHNTNITSHYLDDKAIEMVLSTEPIKTWMEHADDIETLLEKLKEKGGQHC